METIIAFINAHPKSLTLFGIALLARLWVNRRRFYRRGWGGLQYFSSYGKAVFTTIFEKILMVTATLLLVAALFLFLTGH